MSSPTPSSSGSGKLRRTILACSHCRKRKIRCITSEQPPTKPCSRCKAKNLSCQYVSADAREPSPASSNSPESDPEESSPLSVATEPAEVTRNRRQSPTTLSVPSFHRRSSSSSSPTERRRALPVVYTPQHQQRPLSALYEMQAMHARQYLDARNAAAQSDVPMTGIQPRRPAENYTISAGSSYGEQTPLQGDVLDLWTHGLGGHSWHSFSPAGSGSFEAGPWPDQSGSSGGDRHGADHYPFH